MSEFSSMRKYDDLDTLFGIPKDSEEYFYTSSPEVTILSSGKGARDSYGYRYGGQLLRLSQKEIEALLLGKQLAIEVMQDEYVLFVEVSKD